MGGDRTARRFAVGLGAVAAAANAAWHLQAVLVGTPEPLRALAVVGLAGAVPALAVPVAGVVLATRAGWRGTAGLVLVAVHGVAGARGLASFGLAPPLGDPPVRLLLVGAMTATAAGVAAVLALRARGLGPLLGGRAGGWRTAAAVAALALAGSRLWDAAALTWRGGFVHVPGAVLGALLAAVLLGLAGLAALRLADQRLAALVLVLPAAEAVAEGVGIVVQQLQRQQLGPEGIPGPSPASVLLHLLAMSLLTVAAVRLWTASRPLDDPAPAPGSPAPG
jgi:hypothetical protein